MREHEAQNQGAGLYIIIIIVMIKLMEPEGYEVVTSIHLGQICVQSVIRLLLHDSVHFALAPQHKH